MQIFDEVAEEATTRGITPEGLRATVATDTVGEPSGAPPAGSSIAEGEVGATVALDISHTFADVSADLGPARDVLSGASIATLVGEEPMLAGAAVADAAVAASSSDVQGQVDTKGAPPAVPQDSVAEEFESPAEAARQQVVHEEVATSTEGVSEAPLATLVDAVGLPLDDFDDDAFLRSGEPPNEEMLELFQEFLQDDHDQEEGDGAPEPDREEPLGEDVPASVLEEEALE